MCRKRAISFLSFNKQAVAMMSTASTPTTPNMAVKMLSMKVLLNRESGVAQPVISAAAAGLGHVGPIWKAGDVLLR